jgi:hypothetical protein
VKISFQLKQTIVGTGAVGCCFGLLLVIGLLVVGPESNARLIAQGVAPPSWGAVAIGYLIAFVTVAGGSVVLFGLFPAAIGYVFDRLAKRRRKGA